jgi:hypothetical protein
MTNEYRAITEDDIMQEGDEIFHQGAWIKQVPIFGAEYRLLATELTRYRRPIANDSYASQTGPVVDKLTKAADLIMDEVASNHVGYSQCLAAASRVFDACINNQEDDMEYLFALAPTGSTTVFPNLAIPERERTLNLWADIYSTWGDLATNERLITGARAITENDWRERRELRKSAGLIDVNDVAPMPEPQEWDGEGLPPAGVECRVIPHNASWGFKSSSQPHGFVVAYNNEEFWWKNSTGFQTISRIDKVDFEAIKTEPAEAEKEAEAKNRLKFCYAAEDIFSNVNSISMRQSNQHEIAGAFYDAGYRLKESGNE